MVMSNKQGLKTYGLIGYPVKHSLSKVMQEAAFRERAIQAEYRLFEVAPRDLEGFLSGNMEVIDTRGKAFTVKDLSGFNITIPHKIKAKEILEQRFPSILNGLAKQDAYYIKLSNAINTVKNDSGRLKYWNTDAIGFIKALNEDLKIDLKGKNALIVGCGGAGMAVVSALSWKNAGLGKIYINDINKEAIARAEKHFRSLPQYPDNLDILLAFVQKEELGGIIKDSGLLINGSPVGMKEGDPSIIDKSWLHPGLYVYDVVYNRQTQLIKDAKEVLGSSQASGGLGMLLYQGAAAFELWTGENAPVRIMRKALEGALYGKYN